MASQRESVVRYYNETRWDYRHLWRSHRTLAMHFGYYGDGVRSHRQAAQQMNARLAAHIGITADDRVLDAGCGLGSTTATDSATSAPTRRADERRGSICVVTAEEGQPMVGGNSGVVVRSGDTVRRPAGTWTANVQRLMSELRAGGLGCVPQPLGVDERGREVVAFVEGDVGVYPMPAWVWSDELLVDVATCLRLLHDATTGLELPSTGWRRAAVDPVEVICHGDVAPYNTVCRKGRIVALIDWDYAGPAPRGWDLGYAAYRWISLTPSGHRDGCPQTLAQQRRRLRLFCSSYGDVEDIDVVRWAVRRLDDLVDYATERAAAGDPTFRATIAAGHADLYGTDARWLRDTYLGGTG